MKLRIIVAGLVGVLISFRASADDGWTLTTADFNTQSVNLVSINDTSINTLGADGSGASVALENLLVLQHLQTSPLMAPKMTFILTHDDRVTGEAIELQGESLRIKSAPLGEVSVPLGKIIAMVRTGTPLGQLPESRTEDLVTLANGDAVAGIISGLSGASVTIQPSGGEVTVIAMETVSRIVFASITAESPDDAKAFRVTLSDGTSITTPSVAVDGKRLHVNAFNAKQSITLAAVRSIEQVNGPVVWTSSLIPDEEIQTPYHGERDRPSRRDTSVQNQPIRIGTQSFARGIGVHSYSRLTYAINPSFKVFRTRYAIDGEVPWADVTVRIMVDETLVHEQKGVRAGKFFPLVSAKVDGAKKLTLEVDYGENYDVQDRFNWIEAAFLR